MQGFRVQGVGLCLDQQSSRVWVVLKILGSFWLQMILRHLIFRGTRMGP